MSSLPLYRVHARGSVFDGKYTDTSTVIFHQIIETGGSTLAEVLYTRAKQHGIRFSNAERLLTDPTVLESTAPQLGLIYGHNAYGLHRHTQEPARYFTMLREPVVAYVSRFYNWKFMAPDEIEASTLREFVEAEESPNHQARDLARCLTEETELDHFMEPDEIHRRAMQVLDEHLVLCGITDLFEETIFMIAATFGWDDVVMWRRRLSTPGRPSVESLPRDLVRKIEKLVEVDLELYHDQRAKLLDLVERADFDEEFARYKADAERTDAMSYEEALHQKYGMLIEKLRGDLAAKEAKIRAQAVALEKSRLLLAKAQTLVGT